MKRIAIFGATGGVGIHATEVALKKGMIFLNCFDRGVMLMCSSAYPAFVGMY